jgi:hypothetical protein
MTRADLANRSLLIISVLLLSAVIRQYVPDAWGLDGAVRFASGVAVGAIIWSRK